MKKSIILTLALVAATLLASAKQYCHEPLTQGNNTIYLTCELLSSTYTMTIEADVDCCLSHDFISCFLKSVHSLYSVGRMRIAIFQAVSEQELSFPYEMLL